MLAGRRISGRYKVIEMIGGGGMANVYLARDIILDRDVALKVLRMDFAEEEEFIRRFQREAQSATSLVHPNIVNIYDVGEEDNIFYIVMEYVDGMTLKQYIMQHSPIPVEKVLDIMSQLTSAIAHAHRNSIIHRDIKPQNILIDHNGHVKITDFGIAMALSATSITQTNSFLGSVHYISPEQARGGVATKKSDIYSLGIVMYELLTGNLPFSGETAISIALKHLQSDTPPLRKKFPDIPQSVENIVLKATCKDPFYRYNSVEEMEEDIRTALEPSRLNEPKFTILVDEEETKAIPAIKDPLPVNDLESTAVYPIKEETKFELDKPEKKKRKKWPWILTGLFLLLLLAAGSVFVIPDLLGPKEIKVPDVHGKTVDDAVSQLVTAGLKVGDTIETFSDHVPAGKVINTKPGADQTVKEGSSIDLYVSSGKKTFKLDDYRDRDYNEIANMLEKEHFKRIRKVEIYDDRPPGTITDQDPGPNEKVVPEETEMTFTVSKGPEKVSLIDLTDYNEKSLKDYAATSGLKVDIVRRDYSDSVPEGLVISQNPSAGTLLNKGDRVEVVLSKGKKEIPPKTVTKELFIPYEPDEEGKPQEVVIYIEDVNNSMTVPYETFFIHENTKKTISLTVASGKKAGYKVVRDKKVILDEVVPFPGEE
ncbi:MAG: Stk1 family PASTA domain-containing Ser/Thr kinase [Bacillales bacterium]|nr:Stk1 family PASTA domain-containing Ser/Thr kinase [Bacillales bacterium]